MNNKSHYTQKVFLSFSQLAQSQWQISLALYVNE